MKNWMSTPATHVTNSREKLRQFAGPNINGWQRDEALRWDGHHSGDVWNLGASRGNSNHVSYEHAMLHAFNINDINKSMWCGFVYWVERAHKNMPVIMSSLSLIIKFTNFQWGTKYFFNKLRWLYSFSSSTWWPKGFGVTFGRHEKWKWAYRFVERGND